MAEMSPDERRRAVQRTLDAVFRNVPGAREAFPALAAAYEKLGVLGLKALDGLPRLERDQVERTLAGLLPAFGRRQIEALADVLTSIDRRSATRRSTDVRNLASTPTMFAVEVPIESFFEAIEPKRA